MYLSAIRVASLRVRVSKSYLKGARPGSVTHSSHFIILWIFLASSPLHLPLIKLSSFFLNTSGVTAYYAFSFTYSRRICCISFSPIIDSIWYRNWKPFSYGSNENESSGDNPFITGVSEEKECLLPCYLTVWWNEILPMKELTWVKSRP